MNRALIFLSGTQFTKDATVKIELPQYAGIASDYHNIRFRDISGDVLPHWVEHDEDGSPRGPIWVKLPSIGNNGTVIIVEWGDWDDGFGNIEKISLKGIGDDFEGTSLDSTKWVSVIGSAGGSLYVDNGVLAFEPVIPSSGHNMCLIYSKKTVKNGFVIRELRKFTDEHYVAGNLLTSTTIVDGVTGVVFSDNCYTLDMFTPVSGAGKYDVAIRRDIGGDTDILASFTQTPATSLNAFHISEYYYLANGTLRYVHEPSTGESGWDFEAADTTFLTDAKYVSLSQGAYYNGNGGNSYIDWVFVRKYLDPEPQVKNIMRSIDPQLVAVLFQYGIPRTAYLEHILSVGATAFHFTQSLQQIGETGTQTADTVQRTGTTAQETTEDMLQVGGTGSITAEDVLQTGESNTTQFDHVLAVGKTETGFVDTEERSGISGVLPAEVEKRVGNTGIDNTENVLKVGSASQDTIEDIEAVGRQGANYTETTESVGQSMLLGDAGTVHAVGATFASDALNVHRIGGTLYVNVGAEQTIGVHLQTTLDHVIAVGATYWSSIETVNTLSGLTVLRTEAQLMDTETNRVTLDDTITIRYKLYELSDNTWQPVEPSSIEARLEDIDTLETITTLSTLRLGAGDYAVFFEADRNIVELFKPYYVSLYWSVGPQQEVERFLVVVVQSGG